MISNELLLISAINTLLHVRFNEFDFCSSQVIELRVGTEQ